MILSHKHSPVKVQSLAEAFPQATTLVLTEPGEPDAPGLLRVARQGPIRVASLNDARQYFAVWIGVPPAWIASCGYRAVTPGLWRFVGHKTKWREVEEGQRVAAAIEAAMADAALAVHRDSALIAEARAEAAEKRTAKRLAARAHRLRSPAPWFVPPGMA